MAIITNVSTQKQKKRYNIFLDGQYAFSVSENILIKKRLFKGTNLTDEQIAEIKQAELDQRTLNLAQDFLSYQMRTVNEVFVYLRQKGVSETAIKVAIADLKKLKLLDDQNYVKLYVNNNLQIGKEGPNSIRHKLLNKGVDNKLIENVLSSYDNIDWVDPGIRLVKSMSNKLGKLSTKAIIQKTKLKLMQHGFSSDQLDLVIEQLDLSNNSDEQLEALIKEGIKAYKKYAQEPDFKRKQKIRRYLFVHGFDSTEIDQFLDGQIIDFNSLEDY